MGKNWRDAREKARVITYEGSSYWPFLEVNDQKRLPALLGTRHLAVIFPMIINRASTYGSRYACFVANKK
jgi:hypothetical protein